MRVRPLTATLLAVVLTLVACGEEASSVSPEPVLDPSMAGACVEGTVDCVDTVFENDAPTGPDAAIDVAVARRDAESLLGEPEQEVLERWGDVRLGRHGDEHLALTEDWQPGRKTIATEDDGTGIHRVVEVVLELEEGSETFTAR